MITSCNIMLYHVMIIMIITNIVLSCIILLVMLLGAFGGLASGDASEAPPPSFPGRTSPGDEPGIIYTILLNKFIKL